MISIWAIKRKIDLNKKMNRKTSGFYREQRVISRQRLTMPVLERLEAEITAFEGQVNPARTQISQNGRIIHITTNADNAHVDHYAQLGPTLNMPAGDLHITHHHHYGQDEDKKGDAPPSAIPVSERLRKSLQETYKNYTQLKRLFDKRPAPITENFNLALIKEIKQEGSAHGTQDEKNDDGGEKEYSSAYVDESLASYEQLYALKETLELTELFESKDGASEPNKVLVLGRAGIGKSILCQYLATQWASDEKEETSIAICLQKKFEAVFWIKLGEVAAKTTEREMLQNTLIDVLDRFCLSGPEAGRPTKKELARYLKQSSDKVLFILDGYDEITDAKHLDRILEELSGHTHLLLTSRPIVGEKKFGVKPVTFDRCLENMGFLEKDIERYVHQFMESVGKPKQASLMLNFLKFHVSVWGIAHIPINLELLSWLWSKGELKFAQGEIITLSKLYQVIIKRVQYAYANKVSHQPDVPALNDVMESKAARDRADHLSLFLERLAFDAMQGSLLISNKNIKTVLLSILPESNYSEVQREQLLKSATDKLGFLRSTGQGGASQLDQKHYFIHLSFQEFYAAKYIERVLSEYPDSKERGVIFQFICKEKYNPRYQLMLWMSAGLLYQREKNQDRTCQQFSSLGYFWRAILSQPRDLIGFHHTVLVMHCLDECEADDQLFFHKALINQQWMWFKAYTKGENSSYLDQCLEQSYGFDRYLQQEYRLDLYIAQLARCPLASKSVMLNLLEKLEKADKDRHAKEVVVKTLGKQLDNPSESCVKGLINALQDKWTRDRAVESLNNLSNPSEAVIQILLKALQSEDPSVKQIIASTLNKFPNASEDLIKILIQLLCDVEHPNHSDSGHIISTVTWVLTHLNNPNAFVSKLLLDALHNKNEIVRQTVDAGLRKLQYPNEILIMEFLFREDNNNSLTENLLGKLTNPSETMIESLLGALRDKNCTVKLAIVHALGRLNRISEDILLSILQDKSESWRVREEVVSILGKWSNRNEAVIQVLLNTLGDESSFLRVAIVRVLNELSHPNDENVIQALLNTLQDKSCSVREMVVATLHKWGCHLSEAMLLSILQDESGFVRETAVKMLDRWGYPSEIELLNALQTGDNDVKRTILKALGKLNNLSGDAIQVLLTTLQNGSRSLKSDVVEVLSNLKNPDTVVIQSLLKALQDQEEGMTWRVVNALAKLINQNEMLSGILLNFLQDQSGSARRLIVEVLGELKKPSDQVIQVLLYMLNDKDKDVKQESVKALKKLNVLNEDIIQSLWNVFLSDGSESVKRVILEALEKSDNLNKSIVDSLIDTLDNEDSWCVKRAIVKVLGRLNSPSEAVVKALLKALQDKSETVKETVIEVLGNLKNLDEPAIQILLMASEEKGQERIVRKAVVEALGALNNKGENVINALLDIMWNEDEIVCVKEAVAKALAKLNKPSKDVIRALFYALQDNKINDSIRDTIILALRSQALYPNEIVVLKLLNAMCRGGNIRHAAEDILVNFNRTHSVIRILRRILKKERCAYTKVQAARALVTLNKRKENVMKKELLLEVLLIALYDEFEEVRQVAVEALSLLESNVTNIQMIFEKLIEYDAKEGGAIEWRYFSLWFERNFLVCVDRDKGELIIRPGRHTYHITLTSENLIYVEKQIMAVSKEKGFPGINDLVTQTNHLLENNGRNHNQLESHANNRSRFLPPPRNESSQMLLQTQTNRAGISCSIL